MRKLTFWTYSEIEIDDLKESLSELLNTSELIRDYENVWEWIQGDSTEFKSKINVSREHDWEKGKFDKPLILTFDYRGLNKNKTIEKIGNTLAEYFKREVNYGTIHILSNDEYEQKIEQIFKPTEKETKPIWTVVANIVPERQFGPEGKEIKYGTKAFRPKTKIHIIGWHPGTCESIIVVGLARKPRKFVTMTIRADWVENLRVKLAYNPTVIKKIHEFHGIDQTYLTEEFANEMHKTIPIWQEKLKK